MVHYSFIPSHWIFKWFWCPKWFWQKVCHKKSTYLDHSYLKYALDSLKFSPFSISIRFWGVFVRKHFVLHAIAYDFLNSWTKASMDICCLLLLAITTWTLEKFLPNIWPRVDELVKTRSSWFAINNWNIKQGFLNWAGILLVL